jgi:hypothetical protein
MSAQRRMPQRRLRRLLFGCVTVLLAVASAVGLDPATGKALAAAGPTASKFMVVGDSITQGSAGDYTWRYRLYRHLTAAGVHPDFVGPRTDLYDNVAARHGDMSYADPAFDTDHDAIWGRPLGQAADTIAAEVRAAQPEYLLVLLGINDLTFFTDPAGTEAHLRRFVSNAREGRADVRFVFGTLLPTSKSVADQEFAARIRDYNDRLTRVAAELQRASSPIAVAATGRDVVVDADLYDGTHPNARGEIKIAAAFADALASRFSVGSPYPRPLPDVPIGPRTAPVLSAESADSMAVLSWTSSPGATGYWVWRRVADSGAEFERLTWPLPADASPWPHLYLTNGVTYEFRLQPAKYYAEGVMSNVVRVTPMPPAPTDLAATAGDGTATLTWTGRSDAEGYQVRIRNLTDGESDFRTLPWTAQAPSWTAGGLFNGGTYEFEVRVISGGKPGGLSNRALVRPTGPAPVAPAGLTVVAGQAQATLSWTESPHATGYYVYMRRVATETTSTKLPWPVFGASWTAGGLVSGDAYEFRLQAVNGYIPGAISEAVTVRPT